MILIGLGSNLPLCGEPPLDVVVAAADALDRLTPILAASRPFASPAWPDPTDPPFVNAVLKVYSDADADRLLEMLQRVERAFGRRRDARNAPRTLDLDLLAYDDEVRRGSGPHHLVLPHPGIAKRDFVLAPLLDVAPDWREPASGRSAREMLAGLAPISTSPVADRPIWPKQTSGD